MAHARSLLLLLLLLGCTTPSPPGTPVTSTTTTTGSTTTTGTTGTPFPEDCDDGTDNDLDGLLDCEDDDCATDPRCFESACTDGLDNDFDGLADCADEDCWSPTTCLHTEAWLTQAATVTLTRQVDRQVCHCTGCTYVRTSEDTTLELRDVQGQVRVRPTSAPTWTTCDWSARASEVTLEDAFWNYPGTPTPVNRDGFVTSPGCPVQGSEILPETWIPEPVGTGSSAFELRIGPSGSGVLWAHQPLVPATVQSSWDNTSTVSHGSPFGYACYSWYGSSGSVQSLPPTESGSIYPRILP